MTPFSRSLISADKATPVCGETMAQLVATGRVPALIERFGLERFDTFTQVNEMGATAASH